MSVREGDYSYFVRIGDTCRYLDNGKLLTVVKAYMKKSEYDNRFYRVVIFDDGTHCANATAGLFRVNVGEYQMAFHF